jgi:uncharacterized OB-fold protein
LNERLCRTLDPGSIRKDEMTTTPNPSTAPAVRKRNLMPFVNAGHAFWDYLEDGEFRLCRCAECHEWLWESYQGGSDVRCGACGSWTIEWVEVPNVGEVYSWVVVNQPFDGAEMFHDEIPYTTVEALVDGLEGPRVIGLLRGPSDGLRVGAVVQAVIEPPSNQTNGYATLRWRLASSATGTSGGAEGGQTST